MLINLNAQADAGTVSRELAGLGLWIDALRNSDGIVQAFQVQSGSTPVTKDRIYQIHGVASVLSPESKHPKVDERRGVPVSIGKAVFGGDDPVLIAGPCSIDDESQLNQIAAQVAEAGGTFLRGGAFKPRTSPYAFSGHGNVALKWMRKAADTHGLSMVTEVLSEADVISVADTTDMIQVGSRNMQNFALLKAIGATGKPVLLKRGRAATVQEWLMAGEHLYAAGSSNVVFCERGVRGYDPKTRNLLDLGAVALLAHDYQVPVVVDPSHATGRRDLIPPLAQAALAAGACGVMVEVHPAPHTALSDAAQALSFDAFREMAKPYRGQGAEV